MATRRSGGTARRTTRYRTPVRPRRRRVSPLVWILPLLLIGCAAGIFWLSKTGLPAWVRSSPTPASTQADLSVPTATAAAQGDLPYKLYVEQGSYTLTVYGLDDSGGYTAVIKTFPVAVGKQVQAVTGVFTLGDRERWHSLGAGQAWTQYATAVDGGFYIHSPLYREQDACTMYNNTYREIGTAVTTGGLVTTTEAARWIYENCGAGTPVEIVADAPQGTQAQACPPIVQAGCDPTDTEAGA